MKISVNLVVEMTEQQTADWMLEHDVSSKSGVRPDVRDYVLNMLQGDNGDRWDNVTLKP